MEIEYLIRSEACSDNQFLTDQSGKSIYFIQVVPQTTESHFNPPVDVAEIKAFECKICTHKRNYFTI